MLSTSGDAARYMIVLDADPVSATAVEELRDLRRDMPAMLDRVGLPEARAAFAGDTALAETTVTQTENDLRTTSWSRLVGASAPPGGGVVPLPAHTLQGGVPHGERSMLSSRRASRLAPAAAGLVLAAVVYLLARRAHSCGSRKPDRRGRDRVVTLAPGDARVASRRALPRLASPAGVPSRRRGAGRAGRLRRGRRPLSPRPPFRRG